jgi:all-trans-retinol 13,14-reductase
MGKPWSKTVPEGPWDVIVIGSGMGGMTAAALLARLGRRVLVLEHHYVPGGYTHMFKRPGFRWDVGVHAVGEVTTHSLPGRVLQALTDGQLEWASLGERYEEFEFPDGFRFAFPDHPSKFREALLDAFPEEGEAIDGYFRLVREVARSMRSFYLARLTPSGPLARLADGLLAAKAQRFLGQRTADVIAELTDDPRLRTLFTAQWGYYGATPSRSSFAMQALVVKHFSHGAYYPVGGASEIARTLLQTVADAGGWTAIRSGVAELLVEDGRCAGVRLEDGREVRAPKVLSAIGVSSTVERLLPEALRGEGWTREVEGLEAAPCHVCLYLGFEGDIRSAGAGPANQWFFNTWDMEDDVWDVSPERGTFPDAPVLYTSYPSLKDPAHDPGPKQRHTGEVVTFVPWAPFEAHLDEPWKKRSEAYDRFKERLTASLLEQYLRHRPALRELIVHAELSTPATTDHFVRPRAGSIYGLAPTPERFANPHLRPRSPLPGLTFGGADVVGVGVIGAMMGGLLGAVATEPMDAARWLRGVW